MIIYGHGGGFVYYNIESHDYVTRRLCAMNDCTVISVDYRLAPEHPFPAAHEDFYKVIEYVHQHAKELGIDASKIIVAGDSAGGNLAACAGHHFKNHATIKIAAQVLIYPWLDGKIASNSIEKYQTGYLLTKDAMLWFQQNTRQIQQTNAIQLFRQFIKLILKIYQQHLSLQLNTIH